ncbi:hypothetical protein DEI86_15510 [Curtobacterium sp. MCBD17_028]|nr:hypothetical protein DEI86_15510 [Curtobacterium sp. MCBD17_028]
MYRCPVCRYPGLYEPARNRYGLPSFDICPCCGYQFGVSDDDRGIDYDRWRQNWLDLGAPWWSRESPPEGWDLERQLRDV